MGGEGPRKVDQGSMQVRGSLGRFGFISQSHLAREESRDMRDGKKDDESCVCFWSFLYVYLSVSRTRETRLPSLPPSPQLQARAKSGNLEDPKSRHILYSERSRRWTDGVVFRTGS